MLQSSSLAILDAPIPARIARAMVAVGGLFALLGGGFSLGGWVLDIPAATDWFAHGISMQPNTSLLVALGGAGLLLLVTGVHAGARVVGALVAVVGALTLSQFFTGVSLGIDTLLLFDREWGRGRTTAPGRMGPLSAVSALCIGLALLLASGRGRRFAPRLGLVVTALCAVSLIGYLYDASLLFTLPRVTAIAMQTAMFYVTLGLGIIAAVPEHEPLRTLRDKGSAGILARRALPFIVALPVLLGLLRVRGQRAGYYDNEMGSALLVIALVAMMCMVLWWGVRAVAVRERTLAEANRWLRETTRRAEASEAQVRAIIGQLPGGAAFVLDRDMRYRMAGGDAIASAGMDPAHFIGRTIHEALDAASAATHEEWLRRALAGEIFSDEHQVGRFTYQSRGVPLRDATGEVDAVLVLSHDITDRKAAEDRLRDADRRKDEFLAMLAHELRNPLAPLTNAHRLIERTQSLDERGRGALALAGRQTRQLTRLVDDLLEVSRVSRGKIELRREPMMASLAVQQAAESQRAAIEARDQALQVIVPPTPARIDADPARITQVLENLLVNASKFSPPGSVIRIEVELHADMVEIRVVDQGVGIEPAKIAQLFVLFHQIDATIERSQGGLGIGLALVKRLVELHGGTVSARSEGLGRGSTFSVRLPRMPSPEGGGAGATA